MNLHQNHYKEGSLLWQSNIFIPIAIFFACALANALGLETYPGPGTDIYKSNLYSIDVHDGTEWKNSYTYKCSRKSLMAGWFLNQFPSVSFTTFGTDKSVLVSVTRAAGDITSIQISPKSKNINVALNEGKALFTLAPYDKVWVVMNGDEANPLFINADPPKPVVPSGATFFGPGIHDIGQLYKPNDGAVIYLDGGSWVKGNIDLRGRKNVKIMGPGVLSGEKWQWESLRGLTFDQQTAFFMILGEPSYEFGNNEIEGITIVLSPMYNMRYAARHVSGVKLFSPWTLNTDGFQVMPSVSSGALVENCVAFLGDDVAFPGYNFYGNIRIRNCLFGANGGKIFLMEYWGRTLDHKFGSLISDIDIRATTRDAVFLGVLDSKDTTNGSNQGLSNQIYENIRIEGSLNCPLLRIENRPYPYGRSYTQLGNSYGVVFRNVTLEGTQSGLSRIMGKDDQNGHHDYLFENVTIGGNLIGSENYRSFFDVNQFTTNINFLGPGQIPDINGNRIPDLWETNAYWRILHASGNPFGVEDPWTTDTDDDGVLDALELTASTSPLDSIERQLLEPTMQGGASMVSYRQRSGGAGTIGVDYSVSGMVYFVEVSTDLKTWHRGSSWVQAVGVPISNGDGTENVQVRIISPGNGPVFARMGIEPRSTANPLIMGR